MTVTPRPSQGEPSTDDSSPVELLKWILDDHGRAAWALVYALVIVGVMASAVAGAVWMLGSTAVNAITGAVWGGGVGVGGAAALAGRHKRRQSE